MIGKPGLKGREKERGKAFFDSKKGIMRRVFRHVPRGKLDSPLESFRFGWREREVRGRRGKKANRIRLLEQNGRS